MAPIELILGQTSATQRLLGLIQSFAPTPWPILLLGPSGSGKTAIARIIHEGSRCRAGPFVQCPLPAIPDELRHAHLLGFRRGSFTGALEDREGAIESAHHGSLFLDELGHASLAVQQLLLTAVESASVTRIGEVRERPVGVRFLFASATDLEALTQSGAFLSELYWRVAALTIRIPPLAERRSEILIMVAAFMAAELAELGKPYRGVLSPAAADCLREADWPGNIRQLRSVCRHVAAVLDGGRPVELADLPQDLLVGQHSTFVSRRESALAAVERAAGNKAKAARLLSISRPALYRRLADSPPYSVRSSGHNRNAGRLTIASVDRN